MIAAQAPGRVRGGDAFSCPGPDCLSLPALIWAASVQSVNPAMRIYEYEGKELLRRFDVPVPRGEIARTPGAARGVAQKLGCPVAVKVQVRAGGRGKAGGIALVHTPAEAEVSARRFLDGSRGVETPSAVLVEERIYPLRELYLGVVLDPSLGQLRAIVSSHGGVDVEQEQEESDHRIASRPIDPLQPFFSFTARQVASEAGLSGAHLLTVAEVLEKLVRGVQATDLLLGRDQSPVPAARFQGRRRRRQGRALRWGPSSVIPRSPVSWSRRRGSGLQARAAADGLAFVPLDGDIGIIGGGAGLCMATMDIIEKYGGRPANFLDVGGGVSAQKMAQAIRLVLAQPVLGGIVNVYGGINNCEMMAEGVCRVFDEEDPSVPVVVKMRGHFEEEGWSMLADRKIPFVRRGTTDDAVKLLLRLISRRQ